ncbi:endonuclease NucS domain-containing protein [Pseudomonas protegens]|uniref:endonuclease NucS domain-containing protein n=1 Tax=Pseudomonas protegens TaxID=380021 RepID=UPI00277848C6|nr:endonuclease NucS domain-containing protein [Pseudomonas protegens]MDP9517749.1 endonuclease NucS [Pseudomonas protegens]
MTTMAGAIRSFVEQAAGGVNRKQIKDHIDTNYPGQWTPGTLSAHLYACAVNNPKAYIHHKWADRFLYRSEDGCFHRYDPKVHGVNTWAPSSDNEVEDFEADNETNIAELVETSITLERDVETHLVRNLNNIEKGLRFVDRQVSIDVGRVDILAEDTTGRRVVIELKVGQAKDSAVGQLARYLGWYGRQDGQRPRGMLIASEFPEAVRYAAEAIPDLSLVEYKVQFAFNAVAVED